MDATVIRREVGGEQLKRLDMGLRWRAQTSPAYHSINDRD